jgi:ribonuclease D
VITLKLKTFNLFVDGDGFIDDERMQAELEGCEVLHVWERFLESKQVWLVMVGYRHEATQRERGERSGGRDSSAWRPRHTRSYVKAAEQLDPHEQQIYEQLRGWRNGLAQSRQIGPHLLLTNQQLIEVIKRRPESLSALGEVRGIGPGKLKDFGSALLHAHQEATRASAEVNSAPPEPLSEDDPS